MRRPETEKGIENRNYEDSPPRWEQETSVDLDPRQRSTFDIPQGRRRRASPVSVRGIQHQTAFSADSVLTAR